MSRLVKFLKWLFGGYEPGLSQEWWNNQAYDKSGWEGPTFRGKFRRD